MGMPEHRQAETARGVLSTPIGDLRLTASPLGLRRIQFPGEDPDSGTPPLKRGGAGPACRLARRHLNQALREMREYFSGRRARFQVPLDLEGTAHQLRVWEALREIPFGETVTYQELARRLGSPAGARAVGRGCATNPVPVIVPCHRVVAGTGGLQGFGGGLWRKRALLEMEQGQASLGLPGMRPAEGPGRSGGGRARSRLRTSSGGDRWRP